MATAEQFDRIARLATVLAPLAGKQRGMRIEADDWNALVGAVKGILEVDRAQEEGTRAALADAYAPRVHEHLGTVSIAWLASDLQARVGDGGSAVSVVVAISEVKRRLDASTQELARLTAEVEDLQRRLDRGSVDDVDRTNRLRTYEDRLTGIEDLRVTVGTVTGVVDALKPRIDDVLALQGRLTDAQGNPVDVGAIQEDIRNLQTLRESLIGVTGEPLRLQDFENQLVDLKNQLDQTTAGGIDQRLSGLVDQLQGRLDARLDERTTEVRTSLTQEIAVVRDDARTQVREALDAARASIDETLTAKVVEAETRLTATLDARDQQLATTVRDQITASTQAQIDAGLATIPTILDQRITVAEGRLGGIIDQRLNDRLTNVILPHPSPALEPAAGPAPRRTGRRAAPGARDASAVKRRPEPGTDRPAAAPEKPAPHPAAAPSRPRRRRAPGSGAPPGNG